MATARHRGLGTKSFAASIAASIGAHAALVLALVFSAGRPASEPTFAAVTTTFSIDPAPSIDEAPPERIAFPDVRPEPIPERLAESDLAEGLPFDAEPTDAAAAVLASSPDLTIGRFAAVRIETPRARAASEFEISAQSGRPASGSPAPFASHASGFAAPSQTSRPTSSPTSKPPGDAAPSSPERPASLIGDAAPPSYPDAARRRGWEGTTILRLFVDADGLVSRVEILATSGRRILDDAALRAASQWRLAPAIRCGVSVASSLDVPVVFRLTE